MDNVAEWMDKHTINCGIGRITLEMCKKLRSRPKIAEPGGVMRPDTCIKCKQWKKFEENMQKPVDDLGSSLDAAVVVCKTCQKALPQTIEFFEVSGRNFRNVCRECRRLQQQKTKMSKKGPEELLFPLRQLLTHIDSVVTGLITKSYEHGRCFGQREVKDLLQRTLGDVVDQTDVDKIDA